MPASPVAYPLGPPSVSGTQLTYDVLLNDPDEIVRTIATLAQQRLYMPQIFSGDGEIKGGAILYELPPTVASDVYAERDVREVAPGSEFPLLTFLRGQPSFATPRKIGGKFFVTKEQKKRNDTRIFARALQQAANTIVRRTEMMGTAVLNAAITTYSRTVSGTSWSTAAAQAWNVRSGTANPFRDIINAQTTVDLEERGHVLDTMVLHPTEWMNAISRYDTAANFREVIAEADITNVIVTPRNTAGAALLVESGSVGRWINEFPLEVETDEEGVAAGGKQRSWVQWSISPAMFVEDPYCMIRITGIA